MLMAGVLTLMHHNTFTFVQHGGTTKAFIEENHSFGKSFAWYAKGGTFVKFGSLYGRWQN